MSKRKKTAQDNSFDGSNITALPILKRTQAMYKRSMKNDFQNAVVKCIRIITVPEEAILVNFSLTMNGSIASKITSVVKKYKEGECHEKSLMI